MAKAQRTYDLTIPLDLSQVDDRKAEQSLKVVAKDRDGRYHATTVAARGSGRAAAKLSFRDHPGGLRIAVGPADATDEELLALQTITVDVPSSKWGDASTLELAPLVIAPYYWYWWLRWCRTFTIRGRVTCPDGSPVPGATVCAHDVDWWFFWSSTQQVGCATTDINGAFSLTFRWCCGWWPWWWLRHRVWQLDDSLVRRVSPVLQRNPDLKLSRIGNQPTLAPFAELTGGDPSTQRGLTAEATTQLPAIRDRLLAELPQAPELEAQRIWPWYPWHPWWDCTPDIIFSVTQDCDTPNQVLLQETVAETRWNIDNPLVVHLVVDDNACCRPRDCEEPPCEGDECLILDSVCGYPFTQVGGNPGAAATPAGYLNPGPVPLDTHVYHRPFAGVVPIWKNPADLLGFDYYELEYDDGSGWSPLPAGALTGFKRRYWETGSPPTVPADFPVEFISGRYVIKTRHYYETLDPHTWPNEPGLTNAWWLSTNYSLLAQLDTTKFLDGTYRFRVRGWQESGGALVGGTIIPVCSTQVDNEFVLTFDNRLTNLVATHDPAHNCGGGVHLCTPEPDTHITAVRVNGTLVQPCDTVEIVAGATLEIDFIATDADDHLAYYALAASWGLSDSHRLLDLPGASVVVLSGGPSGWAPGQDEGNYGTALAQGATAPHWGGGHYRLTVPMQEAFPDPCCYQLELWAFKRTVVGGGSTCDASFSVGNNGNKTEYSIGVGVCPPPPQP